MLKETLTGGACGFRVKVDITGNVRVSNLYRVMNHIARYYSLLSLRLNSDAYMSRSMTRRRNKPHFFSNLIILIDQLMETCIYNWNNRIQKNFFGIKNIHSDILGALPDLYLLPVIPL
ncbi:hypothetical protein BLA6860_07601 [Burkholderia lata]|nr:hypothetical protein BLA6860_07601 [Burkholderia lata]